MMHQCLERSKPACANRLTALLLGTVPGRCESAATLTLEGGLLEPGVRLRCLGVSVSREREYMSASASASSSAKGSKGMVRGWGYGHGAERGWAGSNSSRGDSDSG